jgi:DNA-binding IclR family transcriptional regulator
MHAGQVVRDDVMRRVQAEYLEMPGLRLTRAQAQRLWGLDPRTCDQLLTSLTEARFLAQTKDGSFVLSSARV